MLSVKEKLNLKVVSFPDIGKIDNELSLDDVTISIKNKMVSLIENFWDIGERLNFIQESKLFKVENYSNLLDYTNVKFGLSKNQTYNFINIYKRFNDPKYKEFNYSNLVEMLTLNSEQLDNVTNSSTVKEIREIKKNNVLQFKEVPSVIVDDVKEVSPVIVDDSFVQEIENNNDILTKEVIKENVLSDFQIKLLDFFVDNYWQSFSNDYQFKFDKSNKLEKVFGRNNICISTEIGIIHEILCDLKK